MISKEQPVLPDYYRIGRRMSGGFVSGTQPDEGNYYVDAATLLYLIEQDFNTY